MLIARALVMPRPNSCSEDRDYFMRLNRALASTYTAELRSELLPAPIKNLMQNLSHELYRRRLNPEVAE